MSTRIDHLSPLPENVPSLSVSFPTRSIGSLPVLKGSALAKRLQTMYLSLNSRFLSFRERRAYVSAYDDTLGETVLGQRITTRRGYTTGTHAPRPRRS